MLQSGIFPRTRKVLQRMYTVQRNDECLPPVTEKAGMSAKYTESSGTEGTGGTRHLQEGTQVQTGLKPPPLG